MLLMDAFSPPPPIVAPFTPLVTLLPLYPPITFGLVAFCWVYSPGSANAIGAGIKAWSESGVNPPSPVHCTAVRSQRASPVKAFAPKSIGAVNKPFATPMLFTVCKLPTWVVAPTSAQRVN